MSELHFSIQLKAISRSRCVDKCSNKTLSVGVSGASDKLSLPQGYLEKKKKLRFRTGKTCDLYLYSQLIRLNGSVISYVFGG